MGSLIHVPIGPSSVHLILNGLLGMLLGWAAFPSIFVALMLQAILFQYGGITVLGVNTFNMAFPAVVCYYAFRPMLLKSARQRIVGAFCCGALSVAGAGLLTALSLSFSAEGFLRTAQILFLAHIPVMIVEGVITALAVSFIAKVRPEILQFSRNSDMRMFRLWCMALCLVFAGASFASAHRVNIFAFVDGDAVQVECGFNRSQKVKQGTVEVFDATTGALLLQGTTDDNGVFRFPVTAELREAGHDLNIRIIAGEGHQNDWTVAADELASSGTPKAVAVAAAEVPATPASLVAGQAAPSAAAPVAAVSGGATPAEIERIVDAALDAKLSPIKRMLAEQTEAGPNLRDIIGGIGWIFGLIGVAAYFRRRP